MLYTTAQRLDLIVENYMAFYTKQICNGQQIAAHEIVDLQIHEAVHHTEARFTAEAKSLACPTNKKPTHGQGTKNKKSLSPKKLAKKLGAKKADEIRKIEHQKKPKPCAQEKNKDVESMATRLKQNPSDSVQSMQDAVVSKPVVESNFVAKPSLCVLNCIASKKETRSRMASAPMSSYFNDYKAHPKAKGQTRFHTTESLELARFETELVDLKSFSKLILAPIAEEAVGPVLSLRKGVDGVEGTNKIYFGDILVENVKEKLACLRSAAI